MSYVAATAVAEYLTWRIPQLESLDAAIAEADAGEMASDAEVAAVKKKWGYEG